jgi:hypothetical protein
MSINDLGMQHLMDLLEAHRVEVEDKDERISKLQDLVIMILDSESADLSVIPYLHPVWLKKAKEISKEIT